MPLIGIANENEFYSDYYLDALLTQDIKNWVKIGRRARRSPRSVISESAIGVFSVDR